MRDINRPYAVMHRGVWFTHINIHTVVVEDCKKIRQHLFSRVSDLVKRIVTSSVSSSKLIYLLFYLHPPESTYQLCVHFIDYKCK